MAIILLINTLAYILADSGDEMAALPLILALSGFIFYFSMYARYRNADKRHVHEKETSTVVANLAAYDTFVKNNKGLANATMRGANHTRVEGALNTSSGNKIEKMLQS